ncbi:MAG: hypothetical protein WAO58_08265 [Fimbriimonadaceae bacterium]
MLIKEEPVIVRESTVIRDDTESNTAMTLLVALIVIAAIGLIAYFAWWAPSQSAPAVIDRQTVIQDRDSDPSTTIVTPPTVVNPPSQPPVIIQGQPGPPGQAGPKGDKGDPGDTVIPPDTTGG